MLSRTSLRAPGGHEVHRNLPGNLLPPLTLGLLALGVTALAGALDSAVAAGLRYPTIYGYYSLPAYTHRAAVADFDGDGIPDVACVHKLYPALEVFQGRGDGTLAAPIVYDSGDEPFEVEAGDMDGDGHPDIVVTSLSPSQLRLFHNQGDGTFAAYTAIALPDRATQLQLVDFDGDGRLDVFAGSNISSTLSYLQSTGGGTLAAPVLYPAGGDPRGLATGDFNEDGRLDLVAATPTVVGQELALFFGQPDGLPGARIVLPSARSQDVVVADVTRDGHADVITSNPWDRTVSLLPGLGNGTFGARQSVAIAGGIPEYLAAGDVDGDGDPDLMCSVSGGDNAGALLLRNDAGVFAAPRLIGGAYSTTELRFADLNGDGHADLLASTYSGGLQVFLGDGTGEFGRRAPEIPVPGQSFVTSLHSGDWDGDDDLDLVTFDQTTGTVVTTSNLGPGGFGAAVSHPGGEVTKLFAAGDLNHDDRADLVVLTKSPAELAVKLSDATGAFPVTSALGLEVESAALGDWDRDGHPDIIVGHWTPAGSFRYSWLRGRGDGGFNAAAVLLTIARVGTNFALADFTGDGRLDLLSQAQPDHATLAVGTPAGVLAPPVAIGDASDPQSFMVGDLNGDGRPDCVLVERFPAAQVMTRVFLNLGSGNFTSVSSPAMMGDRYPVAADLLDMDGDHDLDIAMLLSPGVLAEFKGIGDGTFTGPTEGGFSRAHSRLVAGDWDGDGLTDLATTGVGAEPNSIRILYQDQLGPVPTAGLLSCTVLRAGEGVKLQWSATADVRTSFRVWRGHDLATRQPVSTPLYSGGSRYEFDDSGPVGASDRYWLQELAPAGGVRWHGPYDVPVAPMPDLAMVRIVPNPVRGAGRVEYELAAPAFVRVTILDARGRLVRDWPAARRSAGLHEQGWDGRDAGGRIVPAGVYFLHLDMESHSLTRKFNLLRQ